MNDPKVNHPPHYQHPSGVECIDIAEDMTFNQGSAFKYLWRAGKKDDLLTDLKKARVFLDREIARLEKLQPPPKPSDPIHRTGA